MKIIAVIDDDIPIGDMLTEVLSREGYAVLRAYSGTEALYLLSQKRPDLVLLDLMLPGLSGEEVLPHITDIPVIILSAKADVQDKVELLLGGAAGKTYQNRICHFKIINVESSQNSTGLGLSIAKVLTERMGGSIEADYVQRYLQIKVRFPPIKQ